jgi:Cytochrome c554 and c-prime/Cytochrome c7 and related cytochrome c
MLKFYVSLGVLFFSTFSLLCDSQDVFANPEIIGAPKCKTCHKAKTGDQWKIWTESAHARAFETLASGQSRKIASEKGLGDPQQEGACLKCHVTKASLGTETVVNEKGKYADSEGVGCESCHGPGSDYKSKKVMVDPEAARAAGLVMIETADGCTQCHNEKSPTFKGFDFDKRWAEIAHPVPSEKVVQADTPAAVPARPDPVLDMPGEITYTSSVGDVLFPHSLHVTELEVECVECHHQIHAMELDTPHPDYMTSSWVSCKICHNTDSVKREEYYKCSYCHLTNSDDIADETLSSKVVTHKSCWNCHETGTGVEASQGCAECHVKDKN